MTGRRLGLGMGQLRAVEKENAATYQRACPGYTTRVSKQTTRPPWYLRKAFGCLWAQFWGKFPFFLPAFSFVFHDFFPCAGR